MATDIVAVEVALTADKTVGDVIKTDAQLTEEEHQARQNKRFEQKSKKVKWSINKKVKKVVKFAKKAKKLNGKLKVKVKALKKGTAKITCKAPSCKKAVCKIINVFKNRINLQHKARETKYKERLNFMKN